MYIIINRAVTYAYFLMRQHFLLYSYFCKKKKKKKKKKDVNSINVLSPAK